MKKNLLILTLALLIALPVFGLAAEATTPVAPEVQATETTPVAPLGGQYGPRWRQANPDTTAPQTGYVDTDKDGVCDNCGNEQGKNTDAPNFLDENKDGVCDHFGTDQQGQGRMQGMRGRMRQMMGRMQQMMGRMQQGQGRGQGMMGRGQQNQGSVRCPNYADANNDGVCDNRGTQTQQYFGHCRNRK